MACEQVRSCQVVCILHPDPVTACAWRVGRLSARSGMESTHGEGSSWRATVT